MRQHHCVVVDATEGRLDPAAAIEFVSDPAFGGINLFVGRVRDFNHGRDVSGISYDMFVPLALNGFAEIAAQAEREFGGRLKLYIGHAKGRLGLGDLAMVVAAGTPHRDEAFRACRQVVEAVKHTSPIWKQEHYVDGDSAWSEGCSLCGDGHGPAPAEVPAGHGHEHDGHGH